MPDADVEARSGTAAVVVTAVDYDGQSLIVIPATWAAAELTTYATLLQATTFGAVRRDADAARLVEEWLPAYLERFEGYGQEDAEPEGGDNEPFSADDFFGDDHQTSWRPDARRTTAAFLQEREPALAASYLRPDEGWGFDYEPCPFVHVRDRHHVEAELGHRGYEVRQWQELPALYGSPGPDPAAALKVAL